MTKKHKISDICIIALVITAALVTIVPKAYAKYTSRSSTSDSARTATFDVEIGEIQEFEHEFKIKPPEDNEAGTEASSQEFEFTINNSSEVSVNINASFEAQGNLPLEYELYRVSSDKSEELSLIQPEEQTNISESEIYQFSDEVSFNELATYKVKIKWPEESNSYKYAGGVETVKLTIEAVQID